MDKNQILDNIEAARKEELRASDAFYADMPDDSTQQPIDFYQAQQNAAYEDSKKARTYGSPAEVNKIVNKLVDDFKQSSYNVNKNQYDHLIDAEAKDQAEYLRQGYMTNAALPLVESLVETYGVDAILNNKEALSKLDEVMITGNGSGDGFTKGYLEQMHFQQRGEKGSISDMEVVNGIRKIKAMADNDDIRSSVSKAKSLKDKIDRGELAASEDDYNLLLQVSSYK